MNSEEDCWLLVTDVDDTLLGDNDGYKAFCAAVSASPELTVALNSSRPVSSVLRSLESLTPPIEPSAIIGAMGTEILHGDRMVTRWSDRFGDWSRAPVDRVMLGLGFRAHAAEFQTPFKASYAVPGTDAQRAATRAIRDTGQPVKIVVSGESDFDVLPPDADKGAATLFVTELLGIGAERLVVAGDSANDLAMFDVAERGIVVGNARAELRRAVDREHAYFATAPHAFGLLEGLRDYDAIRTTKPLQ